MRNYDHREMKDIQRQLLAVLKEIVARDNAEVALDKLDISTDTGYGYSLYVYIFYGQREIWQHRIKGGAVYSSSDEESVGDAVGQMSEAMRGTLNMAAITYQLWLEKRYFPDAIDKVEAEMSREKRHRVYIVHFKNGHKLRVEEPDAKTDEFIAKCCMFYDLPSF